MDNIINKMKYELGDLKYQLMVLKEENRVMHLRNNEQAKKNDPEIEDLKKNANSKMVFKLEKKVSELLNENRLIFDKCERLEKENCKLKSTQSHFSYNSNSRSVFKLEQEVSRLRRELKRTEENSKFFNPYLKSKAHRYVFSNIPNDDNGQSLVKTMRFYLNKDTYNMRVRGQYLDNDKLSIGETWKTYEDGQPLSKSKCIRIYIDKKKEGK